MDTYITMSQKEVNKYDIIKKVIKKELKEKEAANLLNISIRQVRRLKKRVKEKGVKGLVHLGRGKISNRKIPDSEKDEIVELLHKNYSDFGPTFAAEKLDEVHRIKRDPNVNP
ncbi:MAG: helix-turn-helix domain-containing protein [Candidatus Pacebacteria bacterium]|nr:helix-turn-helix domain-containing protein [Candidatus Paceibacterota bacterium]